MQTKIQISPAMREFNEAVEHADFMTDYKHDQESASVLLQEIRALKSYPNSTFELCVAIANLKVAMMNLAVSVKR